MDKRGGGVSRYSVEIFLSHSAENLRRDYFIVALISGTEKFWRRGGREYQEFTSKNFCLTVPKISVGNTLLLLYFRVPKKFEQEGGGEYRDFPSKVFCLTRWKISVGEPFTVELISGCEKVYRQEGGRGGKEYQDFLSKFFCLTVPKISIGNPLTLHYFRVPKKCGEKGGIKILLRKFFVSQCRKSP